MASLKQKYKEVNMKAIIETGGKQIKVEAGDAIFVEKLDEAVKIAKKVTKPGTVCLLSPAASSYGYFKNFEERGRLFKQYVLEN